MFRGSEIPCIWVVRNYKFRTASTSACFGDRRSPLLGGAELQIPHGTSSPALHRTSQQGRAGPPFTAQANKVGQASTNHHITTHHISTRPSTHKPTRSGRHPQITTSPHHHISTRPSPHKPTRSGRPALQRTSQQGRAGITTLSHYQITLPAKPKTSFCLAMAGRHINFTGIDFYYPQQLFCFRLFPLLCCMLR